jgi:phospholipid-translocating ATPase
VQQSVILIHYSQAIYSIISPGWFVTPVYGNDHFLFQSAIFWFGLAITVVLALLPRYLYMAWSFGFNPTDLDILNWNYKLRPNMDLIHEAYQNTERKVSEESSVYHGEPEDMEAEATTPHSTRSQGPPGRPSLQGNQIDMSTGVRSPSRGYSFAQEEYGVAMRRMQSNLSGVVPYAHSERKTRSGLLRSIRHPLRRKQP